MSLSQVDTSLLNAEAQRARHVFRPDGDAISLRCLVESLNKERMLEKLIFSIKWTSLGLWMLS